MNKNVITGLGHIGIPTNNIDKTIEFYTGLGFEIAHCTVNEVAGGEKVEFSQML